MKKLLITIVLILLVKLGAFSQCPTTYTFSSDSTGFTTFIGYTGDSSSTYFWDFGDGTSGTGQFITHNFNNYSWNYVCLNTVNSNQFQCTFCDTVIINDTLSTSPCNTYFTSVSDSQGNTTFAGYSNDSLSTYYWDFGDGTSSTGQNATHQYTNGTYYVCLNSISSTQYQCSFCNYVSVNDSIVIDSCNTYFTSVSDFLGNTSFVGYSNDPLSTYYWDFGDGTSATGSNVTHLYNNGNYYVCLNSISSTQYQCTYCNYVSVNDSTASDSCNTYYIYTSDMFGNTTFTGYSNDPLSTYTWTFGNGSTATGHTVTHHFGNVLYGYACLTTVNSSGTQCSYCDTVFVISNSNPCNLYITATSITNETGIGTNDGSISIDVISGAAPYVFNWSNGATTQNISGLQEGNYNIYVTDNNQCSTWASFEVYNDYINHYFNDSLNTSPIDTCLNFIPDTAYLYNFTYNNNNNTVSTIWIIFDNTGTQTGFVTADYTCDSTGYYTAFLTIVCAKGTYHFSDQIHVAEQATGISTTNISDENIALYPNPVADKLYISLNLTKSAPVTVNIMNITGQVIYSEKSESEGGTNIITLNTSSLSSGLYFVQINYDGQIINRKFVK